MSRVSTILTRTGRAGGLGMKRPLRTIAIVGPDGAGKSAVVAALPAALPVSTRTVYLGVNLEASRSMLPTTRIALALKRRGGGRADHGALLDDGREEGRRGIAGGARRTLRLFAWVAEEWYRAVVVANHVRRGHLVICDRHFVCDYYAADIAPREGRPLLRRIHGWQLRRLYPRPDLVFVLDAPVEVLHARKDEDTVEVLARRRDDYLALSRALPGVQVIDATRPLDHVVTTVAAAIVDRLPADTRTDQAAAASKAG